MVLEQKDNTTDSKTHEDVVLCINGINGINGIDMNTKNTNNTKNTSYQDIQGEINKKTEKEKICFVLYLKEKPLSSAELRKELGQSNLNVPRLYERNQDLIEIQKTEGKKAFFGLTAKGREFVDKLIRVFEKNKETSQDEKLPSPEEEDKIQKFRELIDNYSKEESLKRENAVFTFDFSKLAEQEPDLMDYVLDEPEEHIPIFEKALDYICPNPRARFVNLPKTQHKVIQKLRAKDLNKLVSLDVNVRRISEVRPKASNARFECPSCGTIISILQIDKKFKEPSRCSCGRRGSFKELSKDMVDSAVVVAEDLPGVNTQGSSRISIFLQEDLVEFKNIQKCLPGRKVRFNGILKEIALSSPTGGKLTRFDWAIEVNSIESSETDVAESITEEDINEIKGFAVRLKKEEGIKELTNKVAPSIVRVDKEKEALLCSALSCPNSRTKDGILIRNSIHTLLVGDISQAKTQLSMAIVDVTPGAGYASATTSSSVGLTAAVVKDDIDKGWALEAGTFVLHNGGLVVIDELDKIEQQQQQELHEPLEQQEVSVDKANVHATLPANTAAVILANPIKGVFIDGIEKRDQINIAPSIVDRCDIPIIMEDAVNPSKDKEVSEAMVGRGEENEEEERQKDGNSNEFIKKYIYYVKSLPTPVIPKDVRTLITDNFCNLRNNLQRADRKWVTYRYVNALKSISKTYARMRLSSVVEELDINRAINLLSYAYGTLGISVLTKSEEKS